MSTRWLFPVVLFAACGTRPTFVEPPIRASVTVTPDLAVITWEKGTNAKTTLIARTTDPGEPTAPTGDLEVGDALGPAGVLAISEGTMFRDTMLPDVCGPFIWHLWSRHADGTWTKTASTVRSLRGDHTLAPSATVTNFVSTFEGPQLRLGWTNPDVSTAFSGVTVVRKRGSMPMSANDGVIVYAGPSDQTVDMVSNLSATEPTNYAVFNCNQCGRCGTTPATLSITAGSDAGVDVTISGLTVTLSADQRFVDLAWNTNAPTVKILRTLNAAAVGPNDPAGTLVYMGSASSTRESLDAILPHLVLDPRRYTYTAWGCSGPICSLMPSAVDFQLTLKQALRSGGYSIFFQHATANTCVDRTNLGNASTTMSPNWWKSCDAMCGTATAAQLTTASSDAELAAIRSFFAANSIPVSHISSSEFCRALQTAQGFGIDAGVIEQSQQLTYFVYEEMNRCRDMTSLVNAPPTPGTNTMLVGHGLFTGTCAVFEGLNPADAAIFRPQVGAPARYVTRVSSSQWATLP